jgi:hypothetical protein
MAALIPDGIEHLVLGDCIASLAAGHQILICAILIPGIRDHMIDLICLTVAIETSMLITFKNPLSLCTCNLVSHCRPLVAF